MKKLYFISKLHKSTKRNYLQRMINKKILCVREAKKYGFNYWDGNRKYGYGGYKYIEGRWIPVAKKIIKYSLDANKRSLNSSWKEVPHLSVLRVCTCPNKREPADITKATLLSKG